MVEANLELVLKRVEDVLTGQDAIRAELRVLTEKVEGMAQTLVGVRRDVRALQNEMATLGVAIDGHSHRLEEIEKRLGIGIPAN
jgi:hypothetical protein